MCSKQGGSHVRQLLIAGKTGLLVPVSFGASFDVVQVGGELVQVRINGYAGGLQGLDVLERAAKVVQARCNLHHRPPFLMATVAPQRC